MSSTNALSTHPHDQRVQVRQATYPNTQTERETVAAVDEAVFSRVRVLEKQLVDNAERFLEERNADLEHSKEIANALLEDIRIALDHGARPTPELAARYKQLVAGATDSIAKLEAAAEEADWHSARVADPYGTWTEMLHRWPTLRRPL